MKRYSLLALACVMLTACAANVASAIDGVSYCVSANDYVNVTMKQGYYGCKEAWYFCAATNDPVFARNEYCLTYSKKLCSALGYSAVDGNSSTNIVKTTGAAQPIFLVTNFSQGPIFSAAPGDRCYSGLWQVFYVTWKTGQRWIIKNAEPACPMNPYGLPGPSQACITSSCTVLDCPILAVGPLGFGPWYPGPCGTYRIPQGTSLNPVMKTVRLPVYYAYCDDFGKHTTGLGRMLITDAEDRGVACKLKANYAPGLCKMPKSDTQLLFYMLNPKPKQQFFIMEACPDFCSWQNTNCNYSPITRLYILCRKCLPPYEIVNNTTDAQYYIDCDALKVVAQEGYLNSPVIRSQFP